ncbi:MAG TPA: class I SAM-dependent methyltransferase [Gemmatimonadaceae bacterium]|nr:class I SAM-dependent methyltransferase [Gemmatimonadaceae bacterium]
MTTLADRLRDRFGDIDIYLFDQLLRGRITGEMRVLDAGCGSGRNLRFLMHEGVTVFGSDENEASIAALRRTAAQLAPALGADHFRVERVEAMSWGDASMDAVISSAVLHFARDDAHWEAMVAGMWRVLAPGGVFFARLATDVGQPGLVPLGSGRWRLPDGSTRYLVDHARLVTTTGILGGELLDPVRSSVVEGLRSMGTWVVRKR